MTTRIILFLIVLVVGAMVAGQYAMQAHIRRPLAVSAVAPSSAPPLAPALPEASAAMSGGTNSNANNKPLLPLPPAIQAVLPDRVLSRSRGCGLAGRPLLQDDVEQKAWVVEASCVGTNPLWVLLRQPGGRARIIFDPDSANGLEVLSDQRSHGLPDIGMTSVVQTAPVPMSVGAAVAATMPAAVAATVTTTTVYRFDGKAYAQASTVLASGLGRAPFRDPREGKSRNIPGQAELRHGCVGGESDMQAVDAKLAKYGLRLLYARCDKAHKATVRVVGPEEQGVVKMYNEETLLRNPEDKDYDITLVRDKPDAAADLVFPDTPTGAVRLHFDGKQFMRKLPMGPADAPLPDRPAAPAAPAGSAIPAP